MTRTTPRIAPILLAVAFCCPAALLAQQPADGKPGTTKQRADGLRVWWNQPRIGEALKLDTEHRQRLDDILRSHLEARRELARTAQGARTRMSTLLAEGKWDEAAAARTRLAESTTALALAEADLTETVLRALDDDQRQALRLQFPGILARPWLFGGGGRVGGGGAERRPAGRQPNNDSQMP